MRLISIFMNIEDAFKTVFAFKSFTLHRIIMDIFQLLTILVHLVSQHIICFRMCASDVSVILFIDSFWVDGNLDCSWLLFLGGR